jgi:hypothetical protein
MRTALAGPRMRGATAPQTMNDKRFYREVILR